MIKKWAKLLPYWLVMYLTKKFGADTFKMNDDPVVGWRIDKVEISVGAAAEMVDAAIPPADDLPF